MDASQICFHWAVMGTPTNYFILLLKKDNQYHIPQVEENLQNKYNENKAIEFRSAK